MSTILGFRFAAPQAYANAALRGLIPIISILSPATKYGIPFPVFARAAYGTYGSNLPAF